jgi:hypothetical protein
MRSYERLRYLVERLRCEGGYSLSVVISIILSALFGQVVVACRTVRTLTRPRWAGLERACRGRRLSSGNRS